MGDYFIACDFISALEVFINENFCGIISCEHTDCQGALVANPEELANLFKIISEQSLGNDYFEISISSSNSETCISIRSAAFEKDDGALLDKAIKAARKAGFTPSLSRNALLLKAPIIKLSDEYVYATETTKSAQGILNILRSYYNNI